MGKRNGKDCEVPLDLKSLPGTLPWVQALGCLSPTCCRARFLRTGYSLTYLHYSDPDQNIYINMDSMLIISIVHIQIF